MSMGSYRGVRYVKHRICDILDVKSKAKWFFIYEDGKPTGDHFRTITDMQQHIDDSQPPGVPGSPMRFEIHSSR